MITFASILSLLIFTVVQCSAKQNAFTMSPCQPTSHLSSTSCKRQLDFFWKNYFINQSELLTGIDVEVIRAICGAIKKLFKCINNMRSSCPEVLADQKLMQVVKEKAGWGYFCSKGNIIESYALSQKCLQSQRSETLRCYQAFNRKSNFLPPFHPSPSSFPSSPLTPWSRDSDMKHGVAKNNTTQSYCEQVKVFDHCVQNHISSNCGHSESKLATSLVSVVTNRKLMCKNHHKKHNSSRKHSSSEDHEKKEKTHQKILTIEYSRLKAMNHHKFDNYINENHLNGDFYVYNKASSFSPVFVLPLLLYHLI